LFVYLVLFVSFFIDITTYPPSITPFFLLSSYCSAILLGRTLLNFYPVFLKLTRFLLLVYLVKLFIFQYPLDNISLFSKNMVFLPFMPFVLIFLLYYSKHPNLPLSQHLTFIMVLLIFCNSLSIGNLILAFILLLSYISIYLTCSRSSIFLKTLLLSLLPISLCAILYSQFLYLTNNPNMAPFLLRQYLIGSPVSESPRSQILNTYLETIRNPTDFIIGPNDKLAEYTAVNPETNVIERVENPHNTLIYLHSRVGIAALLLYLAFIIKAFYFLFNQRVFLFFFFAAVIIRSLSDTVLIASGFSAFIPFYLLLLTEGKRSSSDTQLCT